MSTDNFPAFTDSVSSPSRRVAAVVPSDTLDLATVSKALHIGTGGDVCVLPVDQTVPVIFKGVSAGRVIPVRVSKVLATGTTASDILAYL